MTTRPSPKASETETVCSYCGKHFADQNGRYQHVQAKHGKKAARALPRQPQEMSMGAQLAEAIIAHHCGEPVEDYLLDMFPEAFR